VIPATRHRWTRPALTPAMQAGTRFTYPGGMEGWVDLGVGYILKWFTCPVTHPGTNHLIATRPGFQSNPRARDRKSNVLTITLPSQHSSQRRGQKFMYNFRSPNNGSKKKYKKFTPQKNLTHAAECRCAFRIVYAQYYLRQMNKWKKWTSCIKNQANSCITMLKITSLKINNAKNSMLN